MEKPTSEHVKATTMILWYVKGMVNYGPIYMKGQIGVEFLGSLESYFASDNTDRKSTSPQIFFLGDIPTKWSSSKQKWLQCHHL